VSWKPLWMTAEQAVTFDNYGSLLPVPTSPKFLVCSSQEKGRGIRKSCGPRQKKGDGDGQRAKVLLYSLLLGNRYMDVDYRNAGFLYDTQMSGLLVGFVIRAK
jgi:hypothetical protein